MTTLHSLTTPHTATAPRPISQISRELDQCRSKHRLANLPFLPGMERRLQEATTKAVITGKPEDRSTVVEINQEIIDARAEHQRHHDLTQQIKNLEEELDAAEQRARMENIRVADAAYQKAYNNYHSAAAATARAFRVWLNTARANSAVPGAAHQIDVGHYDLHLPSMFPRSWNGSLGQSMRDGLLPFEIDEQREAQRVA
jgi:hypothetical protein